MVRKSKILCLPGLTPVVKVDQATGEIGGSVLHSGEKVPSAGQFFEIGELVPLLAELVEQVVVHAVEADQQDAFELGLFQGAGPLDEAQQGADGEGQKVEDGQEEGGEDEKKRTDEGETGARGRRSRAGAGPQL